MKKIEKIVLTEDFEILEKLKRKLAEYKKRDYTLEANSHEWLKRTILSDLLKNREVNAETFFTKHNVSSFSTRTVFEDALFIIDSYNRDDLSALYGGTGLN